MTVTVYKNGHGKIAVEGDRLLPQDKEAERALLGSLLLDPSRIHEVSAIVTADDFYLVANGLVFTAMQRLSGRGERPSDIINLMAELRTMGHADIGDGQDRAENYLSSLMDNTYAFTWSELNYARVIAEMATRRRLIAAASRLSVDAWDEKTAVADTLESARKDLFLVAERQTTGGLTHIGKSLPGYIEAVEERSNNPEMPGMQTGFVDLDRLLNGFQKQHLIILAGRPSMGKTALMLAMAHGMTVERQKRGAVFSLEMSKDELITRMIASIVRIDTQRLDRGDLKEHEWPVFFEASGRLSQSPLFIDDRPGALLSQIRMQVMRQSIETGLDYIMVDYLGLVAVPGTKNRYEQVSESARFFKNLAKEFDVPVIVASQLSRALESRSDKRPQLADLRDSGEIEEAANVVIGIYRDDYYNPDSSERPGIGELEILKNRNGPLGVVDLYWHAQLATYRNLQRQPIDLGNYTPGRQPSGR